MSPVLSVGTGWYSEQTHITAMSTELLSGLIYATRSGCSRFHTPGELRFCCGNCGPLCERVYTHHDDQQNILEVISEAQRVAAEQSKVSLQELRAKHRDSFKFLLPKQTNKHT